MGAPLRKTAAGQEELRDRKRGLDPRTRNVLVIVNGQDDAAALVRRLGFDVRPFVQRLLGEGLIEEVPAPAPPPPPPAPPPPPPPPPAVPPSLVADPNDPLQPADMVAARRRAVKELVGFFGPDAPRIGAALWGAATPAEFAAALAELRSPITAHSGRKHADQVLRRIANG